MGCSQGGAQCYATKMGHRRCSREYTERSPAISQETTALPHAPAFSSGRDGTSADETPHSPWYFIGGKEHGSMRQTFSKGAPSPEGGCYRKKQSFIFLM